MRRYEFLVERDKFLRKLMIFCKKWITAYAWPYCALCRKLTNSYSSMVDGKYWLAEVHLAVSLPSWLMTNTTSTFCLSVVRVLLLLHRMTVCSHQPEFHIVILAGFWLVWMGGHTQPYSPDSRWLLHLYAEVKLAVLSTSLVSSGTALWFESPVIRRHHLLSFWAKSPLCHLPFVKLLGGFYYLSCRWIGSSFCPLSKTQHYPGWFQL